MHSGGARKHKRRHNGSSRRRVNPGYFDSRKSCPSPRAPPRVGHCGPRGSARPAKQRRAPARRVTGLAPASLRRALNYGFIIPGKMRDASRSPINSPPATDVLSPFPSPSLASVGTVFQPPIDFAMEMHETTRLARVSSSE